VVKEWRQNSGSAKNSALLLDGGIRRGTDVLKALALGADAVMLGRPVLWGLALAGEQGVIDAMRMLKEEFDLAMALSGCASLKDISADLVSL
jgi:4-hydroxymandelate oxidase